MMPMGSSEKSDKTDIVFIASMDEDLLHNILSRLPAKSFAFASCVNRYWEGVCNRVFSRPKIISAFSRNPNQLRAGEEVIDKLLSVPIRPHFVIANITVRPHFRGNMEETLSLITESVGSKVPIIVSLVVGILGKEACSDNAGEVKQYDADYAILLTIGYLPGMKVDVIPVIQEEGESEASIGDKFVMDIRNYVSVVSDHAAPACLILFGEDTHATEPILQKLGKPLLEDDTYIGVTKRREYSIGVEKKPKMMTSLVFHRVTEANEQNLSVEGAEINTGDYFQPYFPDLQVAEASRNDVSSQFRNLKFKPNKPEVVGFVFASKRRGDSFFGRPNVDGSPFLENFPELRYGGIFCDGEIGRSFVEEEEEKKDICIRSSLHVHSSVYLIVTYTSPS